MYLKNTAFHEKDRTARSCSIFFIRTPLGGDCCSSAAFSTIAPVDSNRQHAFFCYSQMSCCVFLLCSMLPHPEMDSKKYVRNL